MKNGNWRINRSPSMTYEAKQRTYRKKRQEVIDALGCKCKKCGFKDKRALQIDHKYGGGSKERKQISGISLFYHMLRNIKNYQLLCANCNWIKRSLKKEQPKGLRKPSANIKG